jgi:hypothetical protein
MMKLDRTTLFTLVGIVIVIVIFNIFTREGFYESVVVSGTGLSVGEITGKASATPKAATSKAEMKKAATSKAATSKAEMKKAAMASAKPSSPIDLPAATVTVQPNAPLAQVGSLGMQPISTQQVTDAAGINAVSSIQNKVVPTDSMPGAIAPARGACIGPKMGPSSCMDSSMDYDDSCESDSNMCY